jgi:hypothetical protein
VIGKLYQVRFHVPSGRSANDQTRFRHTRQDYLTRHYLNLSTHERLPVPNDCQSSASIAYPFKPLTMHELKDCNGGRRGDRRICAAKMASARIEASGYSLPETIAMDVAGLIFAVSRTRCR